MLSLAATVFFSSGCGTIDPDAESEIPWNTPQSWEGTPGIPGLEGR